MTWWKQVAASVVAGVVLAVAVHIYRRLADGTKKKET